MIAKDRSISIVFPCYNDEKTIGKLIDEAVQIVKKLTKSYEVIVVDDGSSDKSRRVLEDKKNQYHNLTLIFHDKNKGYGGAIRSGLKSAKNELVFYTDGDGQYDIKELSILVSLMTDDISFVNGIKLSRNDEIYRVIAGNFHNFLMRWLFWLPVYDIDCDFRLIRKDILSKINLRCNTGAFCVEIVKKAEIAGAKFAEVTVHHYDRKWGQSQFFKPKKIIGTYLELISLWLEIVLKRS